MDIPHADIVVDQDLAVRLVTTQFPELIAPVELVEEGWDNAVFRLGAERAIRMPRRAVAAQLIEHEQRWLPELQRLVGVQLPVPIALGRPTEGYPYPWSVVPWVEGTGGSLVPPVRRDAYAGELADFFAALHAPAPDGAPRNPVRGIPLADRDHAVMERLAGLSGRLGADELAGAIAAWGAGARVPVYSGAPVWLHGDPHPGNAVVGSNGRLAAVVDFGDLTAGDPATDLAAAWLHFTATGRRVFTARYEAAHPVDDEVWVRARAWAVNIGSAAFAASDGSGPMAAMGRHALSEAITG